MSTKRTKRTQVTDNQTLASLVSDLFAPSPSPVDSDQSAVLAAYLTLLLKWSRQINLTGFRDAQSAAAGLLYDATEMAPLVNRGAMVLDVGAGAGGLAVTLAVLRPDIKLRVVEPRNKRAVFLRTLRRELQLADRFEVVQARAEELAVEGGEVDAADVAYAQAVMSPEEWLPLGRRLKIIPSAFHQSTKMLRQDSIIMVTDIIRRKLDGG